MKGRCTLLVYSLCFDTQYLKELVAAKEEVGLVADARG